MKIEEIPIRETRWSGQSRFLQHSPYGEEVWRSSRKRGNGSGCSRIIPGYHIFKLMIKNHKDSRIQLKNIHPLDFDLVFDVYTSLDQKTVISILSHELRYSPFMYLCPGFKVIPLKKRLPHGTKESTTPLNLSFN